jgi:hypothetical protein
MGVEDNGLSLEGLAHRLEALERENTELRQEVSALRSSGTPRGEVPALRGSDRRRDNEASASETAGLVSRRGLLSKAGAAAVAAVAAGAFLHPREARADHFGPGITVDFVWAHRDNATGIAVLGESNATGVKGVGGIYGVRGESTESIGVEGKGRNGVYGESSFGAGHAAVVGRSTGQGGVGTYGECSDGTGIQGVSTSGYAGEFAGGKAQLKLAPATTVGKPTTGAHTKGEIYMDSAGALFVCTRGGTPGTWRKVNTTLV